jgi:predicted nucleotidyltransferase
MKYGAINIDTETMGGTPVFTGTRVPVQTLFDYMEGGDDLNEFLDDYPTVSKEAAIQVLEMAKKTLTLDSTTIGSIQDYFKTRPVLKAYLFGSYVREMADDKSDIDILVDLDYSKKIGLQFIQMKLDLEQLLNKKVDLVSSNGISKYIKPLVDVEKRLIYAK